MLAFGIVIPVLPHLIVQLIGGSIAKAAVWSGGESFTSKPLSPTVHPTESTEDSP